MIKASLNVRVIQDAVDGNFLREIAVYVKLKSLFSNSCIYRATYANISKLSGVSVSVLKECIPFFKEKGWARMHDSNMILNKVFKLDGREKEWKQILQFKVLKSDSYKIILKRLKVLIIQGAYQRFEHVKKMWCDNTNAKTDSDLKKARKAVFRYGPIKPISENTRFSMSNKKIGKLLGKSKSTGSRLMKWASQSGMATVEKNFVISNPIFEVSVFDLIASRVDNNYKKGYFNFNGKLFKRLPNLITF